MNLTNITVKFMMIIVWQHNKKYNNYKNIINIQKFDIFIYSLYFLQKQHRQQYILKKIYVLFL